MVAAPTDAAPARLGYQPALDGVRALAIVGVLAFHATWPVGGGGYLGVDVFFALSGFLITSLLVEERATRRSIDLVAFWMRRALRLLPALALLLIGTTIYVLVRPDALGTDGYAGGALASVFYVANWAAAFSEEYQGHLLSHTWSLSIEEQFYLLWPPVVAVLLARVRWRAIAVLTAAGVVASVAIRALLFRSRGFSPRVTYGLDTRASALLLGCLLALLLAHRTRTAPRRSAARWSWGAAGVAGTAVLVWMMAGSRYDSASIAAHPGRVFDEAYLLAPLAACVVIASVVVMPASLLGRVLSLGPVVWLGRISYSLYLWHFPVDLVLAPPVGETAGVGLQVARVAVAVALAAASYHLVERRFLALKARIRRAPTTAPPAPAPAGAAVTGG